jgi:hypothetical protein
MASTAVDARICWKEHRCPPNPSFLSIIAIQKGDVTLTKAEQLRLETGIRLLADRKGVPVSDFEGVPLEKIEKDIRAARVTTWDIARQVAIGRNLQNLYKRFDIPATMSISEAVDLQILTRDDALSCYSVSSEEIQAIVRENNWVAA